MINQVGKSNMLANRFGVKKAISVQRQSIWGSMFSEDAIKAWFALIFDIK